MDITINEKPVMVPPMSTLADVMSAQGITPEGIAVAINGNAVPPVMWSSTVLGEGDAILVFKAFYGG